MVFDANLVLLDGSFDLSPTTDIAPTSTTRSVTTGFTVLDLGGTTKPRGNSEGAIRLTATMILPTAPTTYGDILTMYVQESDHVDQGWTYCADFKDLYALTKLLTVTITTAFAAADIGGALTGTTSGDVGLLRWMHPDAMTIGKTCNMIVSMAGAGDLYDSSGEIVSGGTTGIGTLVGVGATPAKPQLSGPNTYTIGFSVQKRYLRLYPSTSAGSNWGKVQVLVSNHGFKSL